MASILVSISTRNRPHFVRETVLSVLNQTLHDIRVVVSENPTTPETSETTAKWIEELNDPRISYVLQPLDGGEYGQGRFLFDECEEPYFCMIHDDDLMTSGYLEYALKTLGENPDLDFFSSSQYLIDAESNKQDALTEEYALYQARDKYPEGPMKDTLVPLLENGLFSISGAVFRYSSVAKYGLVDADIGGIYPFEFNVFLRLAERGCSAWYSPQRLIAYRWHDTSMRQSDGSILTLYMVDTLVELLERRQFEGHAEKLRRKLLSYNLRNLGYILLVADRKKEAISALFKAVRLNPKGLSLWSYLLVALVAPGYVRSSWRDKVNISPPSPSWEKAIPR